MIGQEYRAMTKTKLNQWNDAAVIIPAQTGWFAAVADPDGTLDKEPVIAWSIYWDEGKDVHQVWPITFNRCRNDNFGSPGYVLCDPHGNFASAYDDEKPKTMKSEAEAIKHSLDEIAGCEPLVRVVHRKPKEQ
jgi:hypothetical protein